MAEQTVTVGVGALSIEDVIAVARGGAKVAISDESKHEMALSRAVIDHLADDTVPHYGISTGFGALASTSIPKEQRAQLQKSLIRSHAAGAGPEVEREVVRGLLVLRLSTLCTGRTGVRPETAQVYADMLNAGITPVVYEYGSLGCSGDLAPLAACALVAMGEGEARNADGLKIGGGEALRAAGITPVDLKEKEGLALTVGADDYITKPFNPIEVSARVKSQLRRYMQLGGGTVRPDVIRVGGIELDDKEKRVMLDGEPVMLTPTEYEILKLLIQNPGQVFSPKEIYTRIWNDLPLGSENTVAVHIRHLREKLEINPAEPRYLKVVWGQGYKCEKQG